MSIDAMDGHGLVVSGASQPGLAESGDQVKLGQLRSSAWRTT